jgi:hypothetical protein
MQRITPWQAKALSRPYAFATKALFAPDRPPTTNKFSGPQPKRADDVRTIPIDFPVKLFVGSAGLSAYQMQRNSTALNTGDNAQKRRGEWQT